MTEKQIDQVLQMISRRGGVTRDQLDKYCKGIGASSDGLSNYVKVDFAKQEEKVGDPGFSWFGPGPSLQDSVSVTDAGLNRLDAKKDTVRERRWTRWMAVAALLVSLIALYLELQDRDMFALIEIKPKPTVQSQSN